MKPAIKTLSPVPTLPRVEMLPEGSAGVAVGVGVGEAVGVAVALGVGVGGGSRRGWGGSAVRQAGETAASGSVIPIEDSSDEKLAIWLKGQGRDLRAESVVIGSRERFRTRFQ